MRFRQTQSPVAVISFRVAVLAMLTTFLSLSGCKSWLDQSEVVRNKGERLVVPILKSLDPIDEAETEFVNAEEIKPEDLNVIAADYVIGPQDLVTVSIFDLINGGVESVRTGRVTETGTLSLPMLPDPVQAAGTTEQQLQQRIADRYREAGVLEKAQVTVTVVEARQRTFYITGAVARPGQYPIVESDFRILHALPQAGGLTAPAKYMYVVRKLQSETKSEDGEQPAAPAAPARPAAPTEDLLAPRALTAPAAETPRPESETTTSPAPATNDRLIQVDGQQMVVGATQPAMPAAPAAAQPRFEFGADDAHVSSERVIRIPLQQLRSGDLRYNIIIRPGDTLIVPEFNTAFYYMGGHVGATGVYNMTGQDVTLTQAIISARMLDPLAVPAKTDIVRRIGDNQLIVRVDLGKIFEGTQPNLYLKPNDEVRVGTDFYPPFLAAIRGAFRATYGFGFLYDRNYAPERND